MKKRIFALQKYVKRKKKIAFSLAFVCSCFTEMSYFLKFLAKKNVGKQHLSANAYSFVSMKFPYKIAGCKD